VKPLIARHVLPAWKHSGLLFEGKDGLTLERLTAPGARWTPREIELDAEGDRLIWHAQLTLLENTEETGVLNDFIPLAEATGESILAYARRWGVLEICEHNLPRTHRGESYETRCRPLRHESERGGLYSEPLSAWRSLAARVRATLNLAAALRLGNRGLPQDWQIVFASHEQDLWPSSRSQYQSQGVENPRNLADAVQELLRIGDVRPLFTWRGEQGFGIQIGGAGNPVFTGYGPGLFGEIALRLAFLLARYDSVAVCSGCNNAFPASQSRAKAGSNRFCSECRAKGIDARIRQQRSRKRRAQEQEGITQ
jgi:hypothetical protein